MRRLTVPDRRVFLCPIVFFPLLWFGGVAMAALWSIDQFPLGRWTATTWIVMLAVPLSFVLGSIAVLRPVAAWLGSNTSAERPELESDAATHLTALRRALFAAVAIGWLELIHQFIAAGAVPLLSANIDESRVAQPGGLTVIVTNLLPVAAIAALAARRRIMARAALPEWTIAIVAVSGFALAGGRGQVVLALVAATVARALLYGPPRTRTVVTGGVCLLALACALFFVRTDQHRDSPFERVLYSQVIPDTAPPLRPLLALRFGYATNFDVLSRVVGNVPADEPYGRGRFSAAAFDRVVPGTRPLGSMTASLTSPFVTATVAGPLYADGGLALTIIGVALIGAFSTATWLTSTRRRSLTSGIVASYVLYLAAFGVYTNPWSDDPNWAFALPALLLVGGIGTGAVSIGGRWRGTRPRSRDFRAALTRLLARKAMLAAIAGLGVLVIASVTFVVFHDPPPTPSPKLVPLRLSNGFALPAGAVREGSVFATDGDAPDDNTPLWSIRGSGSNGVAQELNYSAATPRITRYSAPVGPPSDDRRLDVGTWRGRPAIFEFRVYPSGIRARVIVLGGRGRVAVRGLASLANPRVHRDVAVATFSGPLPDLYVIDRLGSQERVRISVFSGESAFSNRIASTRIGLRDLDPATWSIDIARLEGVKPELLAFAGSGTSTGYPEIHILSGESGYAQFYLERPIAAPMPATLPPVLGALDRSAPVLYVVDAAGRRLRIVPLTS